MSYASSISFSNLFTAELLECSMVDRIFKNIFIKLNEKIERMYS